LRIFGKSEQVRFDLFPRFCVLELFLRKESVIKTILNNIFVLRFFKIRVICVICGELVGCTIRFNRTAIPEQITQ